ncbi:MAG TPA: AsmA family protein [Methyloceanibacter sp.]|nr:AsmA family protein [Methyloceanibacter sp.]
MLRRILFVLLALVIVGAGLIFVAPYFIATDDLQKRVLAQVESTTGYRVRVDGPMRIAFFPSLDLVAREVGIAEPAAGGSAEFITARTLKFGLLASGLLSGKVQLTDVELIDPVITLPLPEGAPKTSQTEDDDATEAGTMRKLSLDRLIVRNGTVVLPPSDDGAPGEQITALDGEASLPQANGPLTFDASANYDGDRVTASGSIGSFAHFVEGGTAPARLAVSAPSLLPHDVTVAGAASNKEGVFSLAQIKAQYGPHALTAGNAIYRDDTLTVTQGTFDGTPFSGTASRAGEKLSVDVEAAPEGKPLRVTGAIGTLDRFLAGHETSLELGVNAPDHLPAPASLAGNATYKDGTFTLSRFNAVSGEDAMSGAATYHDDVVSLSDVTAKLGGRTITGGATYQDDTVNLDVTVDLDGKPAKLAGSITGIEKLLDGQPAPINLAIDAPDHLPAKATVEGAAFYKNDTLVLSEISAVFGPNTVTGSGTYKDDMLVLDPFTATTGNQRFSGAVTANLAGDVPSLKATLTGTSTGNAAAAAPVAATPNAQDTEAETRAAPPAPTPSTPMAVPPGGATEIAVAPPQAGSKANSEAGSAAESETAAPAPTPTPAAAPRQRGIGWRSEKLGVLALKGVNADVDLTLNQFVYEKIRIGAGTVKATLVGGKLDVNAPDLKAYGGGGSLALSIDASGAAPVQRLKVSLAGLDAYPFLRDVADFTTIEGKATLAADLTASGDSERIMVSSLNGTASFDFTDGALRGLNVANMLRTLTTGILTGWQFKREAKTVFNKFDASFKIAGGQAATDDLRLLGPLVSVGGAGTVDLPAQRLKFRVNPFMLASVEGQGGKNNMLGFPVPIAVTGPWDNPAIYPDIVGVLENPVAAYNQLNTLGGGLISMPTNLLGIDTGEGGLVEKSVAVPTAITKGVVGGIGQMLGVKKKQAPPATPKAVPAEGAATPPPPSEAATAQPAPAPQQQAAPAQEAAPKPQEPQAAPKEKQAAPGFGGAFGN